MKSHTSAFVLICVITMSRLCLVRLYDPCRVYFHTLIHTYTQLHNLVSTCKAVFMALIIASLFFSSSSYSLPLSLSLSHSHAHSLTHFLLLCIFFDFKTSKFLSSKAETRFKDQLVNNIMLWPPNCIPKTINICLYLIILFQIFCYCYENVGTHFQSPPVESKHTNTT